MSEASKPHSVQDDIDLVRWAIKGYPEEGAMEALARLEEQLRSREDALREVYELIALGEPDNALHGLDAYLIREGIYRGEMAPNPASEPLRDAMQLLADEAMESGMEIGEAIEERRAQSPASEPKVLFDTPEATMWDDGVLRIQESNQESSP